VPPSLDVRTVLWPYLMQMRYSPSPHQLNCEARILLLLEADSPRLLMFHHGVRVTGLRERIRFRSLVMVCLRGLLSPREHFSEFRKTGAGMMHRSAAMTQGGCRRRGCGQPLPSQGRPRDPAVAPLLCCLFPWPVRRGWAEFVLSVPTGDRVHAKQQERASVRVRGPASGRN
jgi:hypothetical protein